MKRVFRNLIEAFANEERRATNFLFAPRWQRLDGRVGKSGMIPIDCVQGELARIYTNRSEPSPKMDGIRSTFIEFAFRQNFHVDKNTFARNLFHSDHPHGCQKRIQRRITHRYLTLIRIQPPAFASCTAASLTLPSSDQSRSTECPK